MTAVNRPQDDKEEINKMSILATMKVTSTDIYRQITTRGEVCNGKQQEKQVHDIKKSNSYKNVTETLTNWRHKSMMITCGHP